MKEKMYSVAIRKRIDREDHFWFHDNYEFYECNINTCEGRYWFADPFLYERDGLLYLFYEAFDLIERRGKEGYSVLLSNGNWSDPKIIIEEPYHLSFPNIFDYNGDTFIMPEMSSDYSLKLYRSKVFPDIWECSDILLPDVFACDSVFIEKDNTRFLMTNEMFHNVPNNQYASCWVKNYLYLMDGLRVTSEGTKVAEGDYGIRNAGKAFSCRGKLYRIGQDCRERMYGRGLVLFEINSITPYKETMIGCWSCADLDSHIIKSSFDDIIGVHTYNFSDNYEVIDFSSVKTVSSFVRKERRILGYIKMLNRIKKRLL